MQPSRPVEALEHIRLGAGEPVLLVHFQGGNAKAWEPIAERLALRHEVWAISLPGYGSSPMLDEPASVNALARAVAAFMRSRGHEDFHVAGCSLGGAVALELGRIGAARSVCALSPAGFAEGMDMRWLQAVVLAYRVSGRALLPVLDAVARVRAVRAASAWLMAVRPGDWPPEYLAAMTRSVATAPGYHATRTQALRERFRDGSEIACPVTVAWAERDRLLLTSRQAPRARRDLPRAVHVKLWDCGHVSFWDDPDQVAEVIEESMTDRRCGAAAPARAA